HRRGALHNEEALRTEMAGDGAVESGGVKFAEGIVGEIGKINDDEIEIVGVRIDPRKGVGVDDVNSWGQQRFFIEGSQHRIGGKDSRHFRIEIHEGNALYLRILENFTDGE